MAAPGRVSLALLGLALGCTTPAQPVARDVRPVPPAQPTQATRTPTTISIIGTNDLHGALDRLPILAGYIDNLRATRQAEGGGVVLIDAGDMFQGTLASNLGEGQAVVAAYNAIGYSAAAIGNHEFDFGPVGPAVTVGSIEEDPRGALKQRAREATFPFLTANVLDEESGNRIKWPNMPASTVVESVGVKIGIVGVTTEATPFTTMAANFLGLKMRSPAEAVTDEARRLRKEGCEVVVVAAHVGSACTDLSDPNDLSSCKTEEELFRMVEAIPKGVVDVIVAGHTHAAMAHRVADIAVIESYSSARAFGRVDLRIGTRGNVTAATIRPPQELCPLGADGNPVAVERCVDRSYEGRPVVPNPEVAKIVAAAMITAEERSREALEVTAVAPITRAYGTESALGNLFTDLMLSAFPSADVAMTNGGGLRADLPAGPLDYGMLFNANPFDNRFALVKLQGQHLRRLASNNLSSGGGIFSWAGIAVTARCQGEQLVVELSRKGKAIRDTDELTVVTSDFLASGGDGAIGRLGLPPGAVQLTGTIIRDSMARELKKRRGKLDPASYFDPHKPRVHFSGTRPMRCAVAAPSRPASQPE
jgi:5'-nucleotidase